MHFQHSGQDDLLHYLDSAGTPAGMDPANLSHSNSPTNTFSPDDIFHLDGLDIFFEEVSGQPFVGGLGTTLPPGGMNSANLSHSNSPTDTSSPGDKSLLDEFATYLGGDNGAPLGDGLDITWAQTDSENIFTNSYQEDHKPAENTVNDEYLSEEGEQITIIAEPKAKYRERYSSELDPLRNRAQRFIRTEEDNKKYEYPTIRVSPHYFHRGQSRLILSPSLDTGTMVWSMAFNLHSCRTGYHD